MNNTIKTIGTIVLVGGSAYLVYKGIKKYILKDSDDEKSAEITVDDDVKLQIAPNQLQKSVTDYYKAKLDKEIGDKLIEGVKVSDNDDSEEKIDFNKEKANKIDDGVIVGKYFIRASKDKKGNLVVGKLGGKKSVYSVFGKLFLPFKLKTIYEGSIKIKDVDFYIPKDSQDLSIKLIDNKDKTFYVAKVEFDNIINRFRTNTKGHKLITDKGDFKLTKI